MTERPTGHPSYIELAVPDTAAARVFYGELLGWPSPSDDGPQEISTPTLDIGLHSGDERALFEVFARTAKRSVTPWQVPSWLWPLLGLLDRELRAVPEMLHQWNAPMMLDDSRFRRVFGFEPTPIERAVAETITAYGIAPAAERQLTVAA